MSQIELKTQSIDTQNPNIPEARTYQDFKIILNNENRSAKYTKPGNLSEITILQSPLNNDSTPESNIYGIQLKQTGIINGQESNITTSICYVRGKNNIENFLSRYTKEELHLFQEQINIQIDSSQVIIASSREQSYLRQEIDFNNKSAEEKRDIIRNIGGETIKEYRGLIKQINAKIRREKDPQKKATLEQFLETAKKQRGQVRGLRQQANILSRQNQRNVHDEVFDQNMKDIYIKLLRVKEQGHEISRITNSEALLQTYIRDNSQIRQLEQRFDQELRGQELPVDPQRIIEQSQPRRIEQAQNRPRQTQGGGLLDSLTPSIITDGIDSLGLPPDVSPRIKTAAGLAMLVGAGVLARKTVSNTFKLIKGDTSGAGRVIAGLGVFGGSWIASGNAIGFKQSMDRILGGLFGSGTESTENISLPSSESSPETQTLYGLNHINVLFAGMNYGQIDSYVSQNNKGMMSLDYSKLETDLRNHPGIENKNARLKVIESLKRSERLNIFDLTMTTMGLTKETLSNPENNGKLFDESAAKTLVHLDSLAGFMEKNGYTNRNPQLTDKIKSYLSSGKPPLNELKNIGAFYKRLEIPENDPLIIQVNSLGIQDESLKTGILQQLYEARENLKSENNSSSIFEIAKDASGNAKLKTYSSEVTINLNKNSIGTGATEINLSSTYELVKAANLINFLSTHFKGKSEMEKPFSVNARGHIDFKTNDTILNQLPFRGTTVVTAGGGIPFINSLIGSRPFNNALSDISPSIANTPGTKDKFIQYLNSLNIRKQDTSRPPTQPQIPQERDTFIA